MASIEHISQIFPIHHCMINVIYFPLELFLFFNFLYSHSDSTYTLKAIIQLFTF